MAKTKKPLTSRQENILEWIEWYIEETGRPPTFREIGDAADIASPNGVMCHLNALEAKGWITRTPGISRGILVTR